MPLKYEYVHSLKPNKEMADDHPCNAALMVGVFCTSN